MENINYGELKKNLWRFRDFAENKEVIDAAVKEGNMALMSWLKKELDKQPLPSHIVIEYFKLKYFPEEGKKSNQNILNLFQDFQNYDVATEDDWLDDQECFWEKGLPFLNSLYEVAKENGLDLNSASATELKKAYSQMVIEQLEKGTMEMNDIIWEIYKDDYYDTEDVKNSYHNLTINYPDIPYQLKDRKYYILRYYIDEYGIEGGIEKLKEKNLFPTSPCNSDYKIITTDNINHMYSLYSNFSTLFTTKEFAKIFEKAYIEDNQDNVLKLEIYNNTYDSSEYIKDVCYMLATLGQEDKKIRLTIPFETTFDENISVSSVLDADKYYDKMVSGIKQYNFSPLETYICTYLLSKNYKHYQFYNNSDEQDQDNPWFSRNPYLILDNDWEVCAGYVAMADLLLKRLGVQSEYLIVAHKEQDSLHARLGVMIEDEKYGIKSAYIGDPTFDSREKGIYRIGHIFMKPQKVNTDGFEVLNSDTISELPYQAPNSEVQIEAVSNVVNKTLSELDQNQRDSIIRQIVESLGNGKFKYEDFLEKGRFENSSDIFSVFRYKMQDLPIDIFGVSEKKENQDATFTGFSVELETNDQEFREALLENPEFSLIEWSQMVKTPIYDNTIEGFDNLTEYMQLKYLLSHNETEKSPTKNTGKRL